MRPSRNDFMSRGEWLEAHSKWTETEEGQAWIADENASIGRQRKEEAEHAAVQKAAEMGIPPKDSEKIRSGALSETDATRALAANDLIVCLSGNPGCGKTTAAGSALFRARQGLFVKAARLSRWQRYDDSEMNKLLRAHVLVIDDLGTEFQDEKGNFMAILDEVIDVRYDHQRKTILTTNLDAEAFKARYGERIADRIRECGKFVSLDGKSMRAAT